MAKALTRRSPRKKAAKKTGGARIVKATAKKAVKNTAKKAVKKIAKKAAKKVSVSAVWGRTPPKPKGKP